MRKEFARFENLLADFWISRFEHLSLFFKDLIKDSSSRSVTDFDLILGKNLHDEGFDCNGNESVV